MVSRVSCRQKKGTTWCEDHSLVLSRTNATHGAADSAGVHQIGGWTVAFEHLKQRLGWKVACLWHGYGYHLFSGKVMETFLVIWRRQQLNGQTLSSPSGLGAEERVPLPKGWQWGIGKAHMTLDSQQKYWCEMLQVNL